MEAAVAAVLRCDVIQHNMIYFTALVGKFVLSSDQSLIRSGWLLSNKRKAKKKKVLKAFPGGKDVSTLLPTGFDKSEVKRLGFDAHHSETRSLCISKEKKKQLVV